MKVNFDPIIKVNKVNRSLNQCSQTEKAVRIGLEQARKELITNVAKPQTKLGKEVCLLASIKKIIKKLK